MNAQYALRKSKLEAWQARRLVLQAEVKECCDCLIVMLDYTLLDTLTDLDTGRIRDKERLLFEARATLLGVESRISTLEGLLYG